LKQGVQGQRAQSRGGGEPDHKEEGNLITRRREIRSQGGGKPNYKEERNLITRRRET
jgi:hypothetical protein